MIGAFGKVFPSFELVSFSRYIPSLFLYHFVGLFTRTYNELKKCNSYRVQAVQIINPPFGLPSVIVTKFSVNKMGNQDEYCDYDYFPRRLRYVTYHMFLSENAVLKGVREDLGYIAYII